MDENKNVEERSQEPEEEVEYEETDSDNHPIWPRERVRRKRAVYLDFTKVKETFPELGSALLCKLAEMTNISPSRVLELVPGATPDQLAQFLKMAEAAIQVEANQGREEAPKAPRRAMTPGGRDPVSLLSQLKKLPTEALGATAMLESPTKEKSAFMDALKKLVPPEEGGTEVSTVQFSEKFQNKILNLLDTANASSKFNFEHFEQIFKKVQTDPLARSRLENLHAARAHKYGHAHYGPKSWYKESTALAKKFRSQADRRKFRVGLKGLIDFLNQLNIMDLENSFQEGVSEGFNLFKIPTPVHPENFCKYLENVPVMKLIEFVNSQKAVKIQKLLSKISSLAHFSQSMADYFAHDDALEPALAAVCEVLRNTEDVGSVLEKRAATFLSLAQPYDKLRSEEDRDAVKEFKSKKWTEQKTSKNRLKALTCNKFQKGLCRIKNCIYGHRCALCDSHRHGSIDCPRKKSRSREQKSRN